MRRLHLIRHAAYEGYSLNSPRYVGRTDPILSAEGREQALCLGNAASSLREYPIFASTARRARETAALAFPDTQLRILESAAEIDYGRIEGLTVSEAARLYPEFCAQRGIGGAPFDFRALGGEAADDLLVRAMQLLVELEPFAEVVLVSHAIFMSVLCFHLLSASCRSVASFRFCTWATLERAHDGTWHLIPASEEIAAP